MLEPEYFNDKADRMIEIYRELEDFILRDIADRLLKSKSVSGTADRMLWKLEQMGESRAEIMQKLSQLTGLSRRELQALLQDAVITSWNDDLSTFNKLGIEIVNPLENVVVQAVMDAEYRKSKGELENLTRTTMNQAVQDLGRMLDDAEMRVASGLQSYSSAICDILDNYAGKGVMIDYPTGTRRSLEAAVRMCVVTSMNQTSAQITNQYIVEGNIEYVLVSAHLGARTQPAGQPYLAGHENWQGKVYKIRGSEPGYPNLAEMTGYDINESGSGKVLNLLGLHGYNCRHSHKPWDKSLRNPYVDEKGNPKIDSEENRKLYEAQQKQRAMERSIRKTKRELLMKQEEIAKVAETDIKDILRPEYDRLSYKLRRQNAAYNEFCQKNGLQRQSDRLKVAGFKREQAAKASGRARAYEHWKKNVKANIAISKAKNYTIPKGIDLSGWKKKVVATQATHDAVLANVNYDKGIEYKTNCQKCVPAYEMRRRGYDVTAKPLLSMNESINVDNWENIFENAKWISCKNGNGLAEIELAMQKYGSGARVEVYVEWKNINEAHVFVAECVEGKTVFLDPQDGIMDVREYFTHVVDGRTKFCRIDNLEFSDLVKECCEEYK